MVDPQGVTGATPDLVDLSTSLLDAAAHYGPGGAPIVLVVPGGVTSATPDLVDLSTGL